MSKESIFQKSFFIIELLRRAKSGLTPSNLRWSLDTMWSEWDKQEFVAPFPPKLYSFAFVYHFSQILSIYKQKD